MADTPRGTVPFAPVETPDRCAVQAGLRSDPMLGSAFPAARLLLVEQPGPWGRAGLMASRFDRAVARSLISTMDAQQIRIVTIRRPGRSTSSGTRRWGLADCTPGRETLRWGTFDADADLLALDPDAPPSAMGAAPDGQPLRDTDPVFLVCAHGTHDVCCAVRGRPVAAALETVRPGRVWECSHVGGDRFAANVLVLPHGVLYGRVQAHAVGTLADICDAGGVLAQYLRGRVGLRPEAQAALALLHRERPATLVTDLVSARVRRLGPDRSEVLLETRVGPAWVEVRSARSDPEWLTCQSVHPATVTVYQPVSLRDRAHAVATPS